MDDPGELVNLEAVHPGKVEELQDLLSKYIAEGRSTPGKPQDNDPITSIWHQIEFVEK